MNQNSPDPSVKNLILVPTDFSEVCHQAILHAVDMAKSLDYKVCILHIIDKESKSRLKAEKKGPEFIDEQLESLALSIEEKEGVKPLILSREGSIFSDINEVARETGARLMILGTHGKVGFQKLTGSYAMRIITSSAIPVIVVQERRGSMGFRNILFPVSLSSEDRQKLSWAIQIASTFGSTVHVLPKYESDPDLEKKMIGIVFQIKKFLREKGIPLIDGLEKVKVSGFDKQVIDYAEMHHIDLIMIMTESNSLFSGWDEKFLFNPSHIPVMCINPVQKPGYSIVWNV